jgi:hypothetical protein
MKQHQKAAIIGGFMALCFFGINIYYAIKISKGFTFTKALLPELINAVICLIPLIAPAIALTLIKDFKNEYAWIAWLYPVVISLGLINFFLANDPFISGMQMILFVMPFGVLFTILLYVMNKNFKKNKS